MRSSNRAWFAESLRTQEPRGAFRRSALTRELDLGGQVEAITKGLKRIAFGLIAPAVAASDSDAIQTQRQPKSLSPGCVALLATTRQSVLHFRGTKVGVMPAKAGIHLVAASPFDNGFPLSRE
jgi:hypothetical protein